MTSSRVVTALHDGVEHDATVGWRRDGREWSVTVEVPGLEAVEGRGDDAFEALARAREQLEPLGWRIGVAGAQPDVWPSGMARDQGGGLRAYRMTEEQVGDLVDTFAPADPATAVTVAEQRAEADRLYEALRRRSDDRHGG